MAGRRITEFCQGYPTLLLQETVPIYVSPEDNDLPPKDDISRRKQRNKRQTTTYFTGKRYRGQTQSQYLNFGTGSEPGKAEAESTPEGSRAVVSKFL